MVGDFGGVENAAVQADQSFVESVAGVLREVLRLNPREDFFDIRQVVVRQVARVGSRVGEDFVFLVERLGDLERALGAQAEAGVRLALESSEIVELRSDLSGGLFFLGDDARLALAFRNNRLGGGAIPNALGFRILVIAFFEALAEPTAAI